MTYWNDKDVGPAIEEIAVAPRVHSALPWF